ncbi:MAG: hypothetical protein FVQ84_13190 [Planctomycetes bacterium]|nr:hypothetical protein [Planctomycetota bacterium]
MMTGKNSNNNSISSNTNAIIIAVTIVVIAVTVMYFRDRQQKRDLQLQHLDTQMKVWDEWGVPQQNKQLNNTTAQGGEIIL